MQRPFAHIFNNIRNNEDKNDLIALQLMCILDFQAESTNLYKRIEETQQPKLLLDLMGFRSYKSFIYYEYQGHGHLDGRYLKCRFCELYGPYVLVLTHMTINHDEHIGLVKCAYCNQTDLKKHFNDGTMQACYAQYLRKPDIIDTIQDGATSDIVTEFYGFLKLLAIELGVHTRRILHNFTGTAYGGIELITKRNARTPNSYEVTYRQRRIRKTISTEKLSTLANQVWMHFYGRMLPIANSAHCHNDNGTRERSTRLNSRRSGLSQVIRNEKHIVLANLFRFFFYSYLGFFFFFFFVLFSFNTFARMLILKHQTMI